MTVQGSRNAVEKITDGTLREPLTTNDDVDNALAQLSDVEASASEGEEE